MNLRFQVSELLNGFLFNSVTNALLVKGKFRVPQNVYFLRPGRHDATSDNMQEKKNSVAWVREQTIPTERPLLVGEVSSNFCR
jgi:hypothetical protein